MIIYIYIHIYIYIYSYVYLYMFIMVLSMVVTIHKSHSQHFREAFRKGFFSARRLSDICALATTPEGCASDPWFCKSLGESLCEAFAKAFAKRPCE